MLQGLLTGVNAMQAQQQSIDNVAHNLANVNTTGFKRSRVEFQDLLSQTIQAAGTFGATGQELPSGIQVGLGVKVAAITKEFAQGPLQTTDNQFDLAIEGEGFFQVRLANGDAAYTRDGSLHVNGAGQLVTADGYFVQPPITLPADTTSVSIGTDGTVSATTAGNPTQPTTLGQITLARFVNPSGLNALGENLFRPSAASGPASVGVPGQGGLGFLQQGALEGSNVNVVSELVELIASQRAFETSSRVVRSSDEMWQTANELIQ